MHKNRRRRPNFSRLFFFLFFVFVNAFLPPKKTRSGKEEKEEEDFRLSSLFPSFVYKPFVSFIVPLLLRIRIRVQNTTPTMLGRLTEWLATSAKCEEAPDKVTRASWKREREGERVGKNFERGIGIHPPSKRNQNRLSLSLTFRARARVRGRRRAPFVRSRLCVRSCWYREMPKREKNALLLYFSVYIASVFSRGKGTEARVLSLSPFFRK